MYTDENSGINQCFTETTNEAVKSNIMSKKARSPEEIIDLIVSNTDNSKTEVETKVEEKIAEFQDKRAADVSDEDVRYYATKSVYNELTNVKKSGFGGSGDLEDIPMLVIGYNRRQGDKFVTQGDAMVVLGIANPPERPAGVCVMIIDTAHGPEMSDLRETFQSLNTVRAQGSVRQVGSFDDEITLTKGTQPVYEIRSGDGAQYEYVDPAEVDDDDPISQLPLDREEMRAMINENFITDKEKVTVQNFGEHLSATNDNDFPIAFGADVKRFEGEVISAYKVSDEFGFMTMWDDTVFMEEDVPGELVNDRMRTAGLNVAGDGDFIYDEDSSLDVYGTISQRRDGQITMNMMGVIPRVGIEYDGPVGSSGSSEDDSDEDTIGGS